jgi:hypothetical protein
MEKEGNNNLILQSPKFGDGGSEEGRKCNFERHGDMQLVSLLYAQQLKSNSCLRFWHFFIHPVLSVVYS